MQTVALLLVATLATVSGHGYMSSPAPRAKTIPGHRFTNEPQSDGTKGQDCADNGQTGPIQATWVQGQEIEVKIAMTANHQGWYELRFCQDPTGGNSCLEQNVALAVKPSSTPGCPVAAPASSTHGGSCIPSAAENREQVSSGTGTKTSKFILPANFSGVAENDYHVEAQWWYITDNWAPEHFKSCHDVRILPSGKEPEEPEEEEPEQPEEEEPEQPEEEEPEQPPATCDCAAFKTGCSAACNQNILFAQCYGAPESQYIECKCIGGVDFTATLATETSCSCTSSECKEPVVPEQPEEEQPEEPEVPTVPCLINWAVCSADPTNCCSGKCSGNQCQP